MATRAAIYARYSSDLQRDRSIDDQIVVCRRLADTNGWSVARTYWDRARSGASIMGRDGLLSIMEDAKTGAFDVLVVESLDRISRDQEDLAAIYKRLTFIGIKIIAVHEGEADQIQVGIRGLVGSLYLTDLADKVRRGMEGVTRDGRHAGGRAYGYRPVAGKPGELEIVEQEAVVIRRIFDEFSAGKKPRQIVGDLNSEGIPPPRGKHWSASALHGNKARGHGILVNPLYGGEIVWNRVRMVKDPDTGKRVSRLNPESEWQRAQAPQLAIVDSALFQHVKAMFQNADRDEREAKPWQRRKPKRLLSGLLKCGCCGAGMSIKDRSGGRLRVQCSGAKEGNGCASTRAFYLEEIEEAVIGGLKTRLGSTETVASYLKAYNDERRALAADAINRRAKLEKRLASIAAERKRTVNLLVKDVIKEEDGAATLRQLEREAEEANTELATVEEPPKLVELHPAAVEAYLATIDRLAEALSRDGDEELMQPVRALIDRVIVTPGNPGFTINVEGKLNRLIGGGQYPTMWLGGSMVAEEGFEPPTHGL